HIAFTHDDKPALAPFVKRHIGVDLDVQPSRPPRFDELAVPQANYTTALRDELAAMVGPDNVSANPKDRVVHAFGKSLRDLVRVRRGEFTRIPDLVVTPANEDDVVSALRVALDHDTVVIPFG